MVRRSCICPEILFSNINFRSVSGAADAPAGAPVLLREGRPLRCAHGLLRRTDRPGAAERRRIDRDARRKRHLRRRGAGGGPGTRGRHRRRRGDSAVGALLSLLARLSGGKAVVEVGTGAGVSGLWLLSGMRDDGVLTTIDIEPEHQRIAKQALIEGGIGPPAPG